MVKKSASRRTEESERLLQEYPDRYPIICQSSAKCSSQKNSFSKAKFLVPRGYTFAKLLAMVRARLALPPTQSVYVSVAGIIPSNSATIAEIYCSNRDDDDSLPFSFCLSTELCHSNVRLLMNFKEKYSFEERKIQSHKILSGHMYRLPVVVEKAQNSKIPEIGKKKFLIPTALSCAQMVHVIRKRLSLPANTGVFLHLNGSIPAQDVLMSTLYINNKDEDGFLYLTYSGENIFG